MLQVTRGGAGGAEPGRAAAAACQVSPPQASCEPSSVWPGPPGFRVHLCRVGFEPESCQSLGPGGPTLGMGPWRLLIMFPVFRVPYARSDHPACLQQVLPGWFSQDPRPQPRGWPFSLRNVPPLTTAARTTLHHRCKSAPSLAVGGVEPKPSLLPQNPGRAPCSCHQGIDKGFAILCQVSEVSFFSPTEEHFEWSFRIFLGSPCSYSRAPWSLTTTAIEVTHNLAG